MAKVGRPTKYKEKDFTKKTTEYFQGLEDREMPTKSGLLMHLDISRETWREYKEREEFVDTIKKAEFLIEEAWVQRLAGNNVTGAIFYLKNAFKEEYKDRHETDITSKGEQVVGFQYIIPDGSSNKTDTKAA